MDKAELFSRAGILIFTERLFEEMELPTLQKIFSCFIPLKAEFDYPIQCFVYTGVSPFFDIIAEGTPIPHYEVRSEDGKITFIKKLKNRT